MTYKEEIKCVKKELSKQGKLLEKIATAIIGDDISRYISPYNGMGGYNNHSG
mgnify:CR=1 FL=1